MIAKSIIILLPYMENQLYTSWTIDYLQNLFNLNYSALRYLARSILN